MTKALLRNITGLIAKITTPQLPLFLIVTTSIFLAQPAHSGPSKPIESSRYDHTHSDFSQLLKEILVSDGPQTRVSYKTLRKKAVLFNKYLKITSNIKRSLFETFSAQEQMAFLINAYNAFTLKLIVDNYPVKSVKKIGGFAQPAKIRFIRLLGRDFSLENIEQELRKKYSDPRVYLTLSCASLGCPPLKNEAYQASELDRQLDEQAKSFLRDGVQNQLDTTAKTIKLSNVFETYKEEFDKSGGILKFASKYITDDPLVVQSLEGAEYNLSFSEYNWDLNEAK